jgi:hypothetical protein
MKGASNRKSNHFHAIIFLPRLSVLMYRQVAADIIAFYSLSIQTTVQK